MEWWRKMMFPVRRVWTGVVSRFRIRKSGMLKLQNDVKACQYEDVQVMWEMLQRNEMEQTPPKRRGDNRLLFWSFFGWARSAPSLCQRF